MDVFTVAAVALAVLHELGEPVPSAMSRAGRLDALYGVGESSSGSSRSDRMAFVVAAGGEVTNDG
jgi:hypothetical protein